MLQFYKPNPKVTGSACSFWASTTEKAVFGSFIKQDGWNTKSRTGSFNKNKDNPKAKAIVKFSVTEAASLIDAISRNGTVNKDSKEDSTNKSSFIIGLTFGEATALRIYLERNLGKIFDVMDTPHTDGSHPPAKKPAKKTEEPASENSDILDEEW